TGRIEVGPGMRIRAAHDILFNVTEEPGMINHYDLHRRILERERQLLEKRAVAEAQVQTAIDAIRSERQAQAEAKASRRREQRGEAILPIRPFRRVMLRLSQAWGRP